MYYRHWCICLIISIYPVPPLRRLFAEVTRRGPALGRGGGTKAPRHMLLGAGGHCMGFRVRGRKTPWTGPVLSGHANLVHVSPHLRLCFGIASSALRGQKKQLENRKLKHWALKIDLCHNLKYQRIRTSVSRSLLTVTKASYIYSFKQLSETSETHP